MHGSMVWKSLVSSIVFLSLVISLHAQDVIITGVTTTPVSCGDGSDGTIRVTVSGGIGRYTYLLVRQGVPVETSGPIIPQTYTFTGHDKYINYIIIVSDESTGTADGFTFATIDGPEPVSITSYDATDITCNGFNDGTITVTAAGEQGNYIFDLTGPVNQSNGTGFFPDLPEGEFTVTVGDADGCPSTDVTPVLTVNNPTGVSIGIDQVTDVDCYGDNTGSISITPSGGTPSGTGRVYLQLERTGRFYLLSGGYCGTGEWGLFRDRI